MPFSMANAQVYSLEILQFFTTYPKRKRKNKKIVTLQVRILVFYLYNQMQSCGKKAFLSVPASMTLEASLILSLLIFASVSLILPMKILNTERKIQAGLEAVGEELSQYAYLQDVIKKGDGEKIPGADSQAREFCKNLVGKAAEVYVLYRIQEHVDTRQVIKINPLKTSIMEDGEILDLRLDYQIKMPFPVLGLKSIHCTARSRRRAWIGREGQEESGTDIAGETGEEEIVYVGRSSTRYHRNRTCHYLANQLNSADAGQIEELRNKSGGKYYPCKVCGGGGALSGVVYIMPEGSSYHRTKNCSSIVSYVKAVKLKEVSYLGPCSYCGHK